MEPGSRLAPRRVTASWLADVPDGRHDAVPGQPRGWSPCRSPPSRRRATVASPSLVDWSGDGTRALFTTSENGNTVLTQVDLRNGSKTTFTVKGTSPTPRYTRPDGKAVLLEMPKGLGSGSLERVDLAGNHQLTYPVGPDFQGYLSTPDGTRLVLGTGTGLALMGNDAVAGKALPIAGQTECAPMRWWDTGSNDRPRPVR